MLLRVSKIELSAVMIALYRGVSLQKFRGYRFLFDGHFPTVPKGLAIPEQSLLNFDRLRGT